jgi:hypothetical protein
LGQPDTILVAAASFLLGDSSPVFDLVPLAAQVDGALVPAELDAARSYAEAEKAASTRREYSLDWNKWRVWCAERSLSPLPAEPGAIAAWLAFMAQAGIRPNTITRRLAALRYAHKL